MKKSTKKSLQIALLLCIVGLVICLVSFVAVGFDIKKMSTVTYETNTHEVNEDFSNITIKTETADLHFVQWEEEGCKIVCHEEARVRHTATVQDETLVITVTDARKWYDHIGISFDDAELTVYLPKEQYEALEIKSDTGDVELSEDFAFETGKAETDTGEITWKASVADGLVIETDTGEVKVDTEKLGELHIKTSTGDVSVDSVENALIISVETDTGEILLNSIKCRSFTTKSDTGEIRITDTVAGFCGTVVSETGDVTLENSDAVESLSIKTDTGHVTGSLLSGKIFYTETDTGNVDVPRTNGGPCEITTNTGDIHIEVIGK